MNPFTARIECWEDTLYMSQLLEKSIPASISVKVRYDPDFTYEKQCDHSYIYFVNKDSIDCCLEHAPKALVVNLADDNFAGGCVAQGSGAQEESLFRRTNYVSSLKQELYPILADEAIYSPDVLVLKTNESSGWELLNPGHTHGKIEEWSHGLPRIAFIACPGIKYPETLSMPLTDASGNETEAMGERLQEADVDILKKKIKTILQTAIRQGHDSVILGAMGCGAWRNPIDHVAEIFKSVLREWDGCLSHIYFAILHTTDDNYIVRRFNSEKKKTIDIFKQVFFDATR